MSVAKCSLLLSLLSSHSSLQGTKTSGNWRSGRCNGRRRDGWLPTGWMARRVMTGGEKGGARRPNGIRGREMGGAGNRRGEGASGWAATGGEKRRRDGQRQMGRTTQRAAAGGEKGRCA
uniref:Uncharacterized protein n=1 Tax=Oryza punctata TaxID=4537 RepID=A0A0E0L9C9_ORYPU